MVPINMRTRELIALLQQQPPDAHVSINDSEYHPTSVTLSTRWPTVVNIGVALGMDAEWWAESRLDETGPTEV